jgi:hypothetical protein
LIAVSRTVAAFPKPAGGSGTIEPEIADAGEATAPASLLDRYEPSAIILVAGASPHMRSLQQQTWETLSVNWQADVCCRCQPRPGVRASPRIAVGPNKSLIVRPLPPHDYRHSDAAQAHDVT